MQWFSVLSYLLSYWIVLYRATKYHMVVCLLLSVNNSFLKLTSFNLCFPDKSLNLILLAQASAMYGFNVASY